MGWYKFKSGEKEAGDGEWFRWESRFSRSAVSVKAGGESQTKREQDALVGSRITTRLRRGWHPNNLQVLANAC